MSGAHHLITPIIEDFISGPCSLVAPNFLGKPERIWNTNEKQMKGKKKKVHNKQSQKQTNKLVLAYA